MVFPGFTTEEPVPAERAMCGVNVADRLSAIAEQMPTEIAVALPGHGDMAGKNCYTTCTFAELEHDTSALARGLVDLGVTPGTRLVLLVKPGVEFVKLVFALLRSGATTILIDPGMGKKHLVECLALTEPAGFVAISIAQAVRTLFRTRFPQATLNVTVGRRWFWGGPTYRQLLAQGSHSQSRLPKLQASDPAAIIFTSGSTGPPKGVLYSHQMFETQVAEIQREYDLQPGGADLACFALFGLFNSAMGVTTVFPEMDFARPATADPQMLLTAAHDWQVTQAFASPAVWDRLSRYCQAEGELIPTLRKVFSCGAPVPAEVLQRTLDCVAAGAQMHTPYGATESLPVATIEASEVLTETADQTARGAGVCVGRKFPTIEWRVIRISDEPIAQLDDCEELPVGEIGELIVRGPQVSREYLGAGGWGLGNIAEQDTLSKIADKRAGASSPPADIWHRMGDVGYLDAEGRFWYCGRKNHRVETQAGTLFTECVEGVFNEHPRVRRAALVGVGESGRSRPGVIIEPSPEMIEKHGTNFESTPYLELKTQLGTLAGRNQVTSKVKDFLFRASLPVDVRHNSKINREELARWASRELRVLKS